MTTIHLQRPRKPRGHSRPSSTAGLPIAAGPARADPDRIGQSRSLSMLDGRFLRVAIAPSQSPPPDPFQCKSVHDRFFRCFRCFLCRPILRPFPPHRRSSSSPGPDPVQISAIDEFFLRARSLDLSSVCNQLSWSSPLPAQHSPSKRPDGFPARARSGAGRRRQLDHF